MNTFTGLKLKANMKGEKTDMCKAWEDHEKRGKIEATARLNKLTTILIDSGRIDDLKRSAMDSDYQEELLKKLVPENE